VKAPKSRGTIAELIDARTRARGQSPPERDPRRPIPGEFDVVTFIDQVRKESAANERIILDSEGLSAGDLVLLKAELAAAGLGDRVLIHE
jgi:hypothetical protein